MPALPPDADRAPTGEGRPDRGGGHAHWPRSDRDARAPAPGDVTGGRGVAEGATTIRPLCFLTCSRVPAAPPDLCRHRARRHVADPARGRTGSVGTYRAGRGPTGSGAAGARVP